MELRNIEFFNADYHKDGTLVWKEIQPKDGKPRKQKQYNEIPIRKIIEPDSLQIDEEVLKESERLYYETGRLIPVYLSFEFRLIAGFEQFVLAKRLGLETVPFLRRRMTGREQTAFSKSVSDRKFQGKKYPVKTQANKTVYISMNQKKKLGKSFKLAKLAGLRLQVFDDFSIAAMDNEGNYWFGSPEKGLHVETATHKLEMLLGEVGTNG